jgi:FkbM family methyltransferase
MLKFPIPSYSQCGEDRLIWKLFGYRSTGTYVDIGCYHPTNYSVTYLLYLAGWRGLAIDADNHFLPLYAQARPEDTVCNFAISKTPRMATLLIFEGRSMNTLDPAIAAKYEAETTAKRAGTQQVEVRRLDRLLAEACIESIDFLNIDVEGCDLDVLESNDWQRWKPAIIAIEDQNIELNAVQRSEIFRFLNPHGYYLHSQCHHTSVYCRR